MNDLKISSAGEGIKISTCTFQTELIQLENMYLVGIQTVNQEMSKTHQHYSVLRTQRSVKSTHT